MLANNIARTTEIFIEDSEPVKNILEGLYLIALAQMKQLKYVVSSNDNIF